MERRSQEVARGDGGNDAGHTVLETTPLRKAEHRLQTHRLRLPGSSLAAAVVTHSGTRANPSSEDAAGAKFVRKEALNDRQLGRVNSLVYTTARRTDFTREGEHISAFESIDRAAGSPDYKVQGFLGGRQGEQGICSQPLSIRHIITATKTVERGHQIKMTNLKEFDVYELLRGTIVNRTT